MALLVETPRSTGRVNNLVVPATGRIFAFCNPPPSPPPRTHPPTRRHPLCTCSPPPVWRRAGLTTDPNNRHFPRLIPSKPPSPSFILPPAADTFNCDNGTLWPSTDESYQGGSAGCPTRTCWGVGSTATAMTAVRAGAPSGTDHGLREGRHRPVKRLGRPSARRLERRHAPRRQRQPHGVDAVLQSLDRGRPLRGLFSFGPPRRCGPGSPPTTSALSFFFFFFFLKKIMSWSRGARGLGRGIGNLGGSVAAAVTAAAAVVRHPRQY